MLQTVDTWHLYIFTLGGLVYIPCVNEAFDFNYLLFYLICIMPEDNADTFIERHMGPLPIHTWIPRRELSGNRRVCL